MNLKIGFCWFLPNSCIQSQPVIANIGISVVLTWTLVIFLFMLISNMKVMTCWNFTCSLTIWISSLVNQIPIFEYWKTSFPLCVCVCVCAHMQTCYSQPKNDRHDTFWNLIWDVRAIWLWHLSLHSSPGLNQSCTTAHSNARSFTHWVRPGTEPVSSWILVRFISAEPWRELPPSLFKACYDPLPVYVNKVLLARSHTHLVSLVCGCSLGTTTGLTTYSGDCRVHKENID